MITFTKPSLVNRRRKRKWRNLTLADLIKAGLTDCYGLAHNVRAALIGGTGLASRTSGTAATIAVFLCAKISVLHRYVGLGGHSQEWPVLVPVGQPAQSGSMIGFMLSGFNHPYTRYPIMNTQNKSVQNSGHINSEQDNTQAIDQERSFGTVSTSSALSLLLEKAIDHLDIYELKHIANMNNLATSELDNLDDGVLALGMLLNSNEDKYELDGTTMSSVLFGLSHQINTIKGLLFIADKAAYRLANPKTKTNGKADEAEARNQQT